MTKREIEKLLAQAGFRKRGGGRHDVWVKIGFPPIPIPRHKGDIPEGTARNIMKCAGLKEKNETVLCHFQKDQECNRGGISRPRRLCNIR